MAHGNQLAHGTHTYYCFKEQEREKKEPPTKLFPHLLHINTVTSGASQAGLAELLSISRSQEEAGDEHFSFSPN